VGDTMNNSQRLAVQLGGTCDITTLRYDDLQTAWDNLTAPQLAWLLARVGFDFRSIVDPIVAKLPEILERELVSKSTLPIQAYNIVARYLQYVDAPIADIYRSAFTYEEVLGACLSTIGS